MTDPPESIARAAYNAAQSAAAADDDLNGAVLIGLYAIAEWAGQDDTTYLTQHSVGADGNPLTDWRSMGYVAWAHEDLKPPPSWMMAVDPEDEDE
jgi:hypothetical protein